MCFTEKTDDSSEEMTLSEFVNNHLNLQKDQLAKKQEKKNVLHRMVNDVLTGNIISRLREHPQQNLNKSSPETNPALRDTPNRNEITISRRQSKDASVSKYELRKRHVPIEVYPSKTSALDCPSVPSKSSAKKHKNTLFCGLYAIQIEYEHLPTPTFSSSEAITHSNLLKVYSELMPKRSDKEPQPVTTPSIPPNSLPLDEKMSDKHKEETLYAEAPSAEQKEGSESERDSENKDKQLEPSS